MQKRCDYKDCENNDLDYLLDLNYTFKKCSKCKNRYYCRRECQKKDWIEHKKICEEKKKCELVKYEEQAREKCMKAIEVIFSKLSTDKLANDWWHYESMKEFQTH